MLLHSEPTLETYRGILPTWRSVYLRTHSRPSSAPNNSPPRAGWPTDGSPFNSQTDLCPSAPSGTPRSRNNVRFSSLLTQIRWRACGRCLTPRVEPYAHGQCLLSWPRLFARHVQVLLEPCLLVTVRTLNDLPPIQRAKLEMPATVLACTLDEARMYGLGGACRCWLPPHGLLFRDRPGRVLTKPATSARRRTLDR